MSAPSDALEALSELRGELEKFIRAELVRLDAERSFLEIVLANTSDRGVSNRVVDVKVINKVENLIGLTREA